MGSTELPVIDVCKINPQWCKGKKPYYCSQARGRAAAAAAQHRLELTVLTRVQNPRHCCQGADRPKGKPACPITTGMSR